MKKITAPRLRDYFQAEYKSIRTRDFLSYNQSVFNKVSLLTLFIIINLIVAFGGNRNAGVFALATFLFLVMQFLKSLRLGRGIAIRRKTEDSSREGDETTVHYQLVNASAFPLNDLYFTDLFNGTKGHVLGKEIGDSLEPHQRYDVTVKAHLNEGMGTKYFSGLCVYLVDELGLFRFKVEETKNDSLHVYPRIEALEPEEVKGNINAIHFGLHEFRTRGESTNFFGIKEYAYGDPVKRINWKLSQKREETLVNLFEKVVNSSITLLLNLDFRIHSGDGAESTLEYCKDLALGIAVGHMENGNEIQLISNERRVPFGIGQHHINLLEMTICDLSLGQDEKAGELVGRAYTLMPPQSMVFFISPIVAGDVMTKNLHQLVRLRRQGMDVCAIFVNGVGHVSTKIRFGSVSTVKGLDAATQKLIQTWVPKLKAIGIKVKVIDVKENGDYNRHLRESMRREN